MIQQFDHLEIRCPILGHPLHFSYCRCTQGNVPCRKILDCWHQRIPIQQFVHQHFDRETVQRLVAAPKPKLMSILEIAQRAKASKKNGTIPTKEIEM